MKASVATVTLTGIAPMTQSRAHETPKLEGENPNDYDIRTWRNKLSTETNGDRRTIVIPAHGVMQCIAAAAKYSKRQIPGQGKATWTAKFTAGITLMENPRLNLDPTSVGSITISANADGVRGSGKRVPRRFPVIPTGWSTTFDVYILDPIITEQIFREMVELAGMFIGLGQFRPQNGGTNGRFKLADLVWTDNRQIAA
mgnify:CR=1 FL=1|tara:strand:+ start:2168 stop:2764 length:597 start_codon:yes stop_codon:yes gene_type:complete